MEQHQKATAHIHSGMLPKMVSISVTMHDGKTRNSFHLSTYMYIALWVHSSTQRTSVLQYPNLQCSMIPC